MPKRLISVILVLLLAAGVARAAPEAELWDRWLAHDEAATETVDHWAWGELLARYLRPSQDGVNRFDYGAVTREDRAALDAYIAQLAAVPVSSLRRSEQYAFWINLYNALTVAVVLAHYPVETIRDIDTSPGFFSNGPWGQKIVSVEGEEISLDDIEHRILRPIWRDPRIHYAVNCASYGCPNLLARPFAAETIEAQLSMAAMAYVNHPRGVTIENGHLTVSSIYDWYQEDFGGDEPGVVSHLLAYAEPELAMKLQGFTRIDDYTYDWRLNDARP